MKRSTATTLLVILGLLVVLPVGCGLAAMFINPYPTDAEMEAFLRDNRGDFETLARMVEEDKELTIITEEREFWSEYGVSTPINNERKRTYIDLMSNLNILRIDAYQMKGTRSIFMMTWTTPNMIFGAKSKFYAYKFHTPVEEVESLDKIYRGGGDSAASKKIDELWSLKLDIW